MSINPEKLKSAIEKLKEIKRHHLPGGCIDQEINSVLSDLGPTWYLHVEFEYPNKSTQSVILCKSTDKEVVEQTARFIWNNKVKPQFLEMISYHVTDSEIPGWETK